MLTATELAAELRVSVETVRRLARSGRVPATRLGRRYRFDRARVLEALATTHQPAATTAPAATQAPARPALVQVRGPYIPPLED